MIPVPTIQSKSEEEIDRATRSRVETIINSLDLKDLNEEERESIISLVTEYPHQFHLPGDKLSKTSAVKHKIITTDEAPLM